MDGRINSVFTVDPATQDKSQHHIVPSGSASSANATSHVCSLGKPDMVHRKPACACFTEWLYTQPVVYIELCGYDL